MDQKMDLDQKNGPQKLAKKLTQNEPKKLTPKMNLKI